ncbi:hypothetical protein SAMD00019534_084740, partial [Acytostelium subglobosum LB1]|uniref:hypothetical protein n=1 Tax=Acytostelium subglobosum LB1 TaxID=1410327 RepID=UPI0006449556
PHSLSHTRLILEHLSQPSILRCNQPTSFSCLSLSLINQSFINHSIKHVLLVNDSLFVFL